MIDLEQLMGAKGRGRWKKVECPVCGNKRAGITAGDKGWVFNCWEGCSIEDVCDSLGIGVCDLFWEEDRRPRYGFDLELERHVLAAAISSRRNGNPVRGKDRYRAMQAVSRLKSVGKYEETMRMLV